MKKIEIYPWNQLIEWYLADEQMPFLEVFKFIVVNHHYFRNKCFDRIKHEYDTEPEDHFQDLCIEIDRLSLLRRWKDKGLTDEQLNKNIRGLIRNRLIDRARKKKKEGINIQIDDDSNASIQAEIEKKHRTQDGFGKNDLGIINSIEKNLRERQAIILYEYHKFGIGGTKGRDFLALELGVSVKTIEKDIRIIKDIAEEEYLNRFTYLEKYSKRNKK